MFGLIFLLCNKHVANTNLFKNQFILHTAVGSFDSHWTRAIILVASHEVTRCATATRVEGAWVFTHCKNDKNYIIYFIYLYVYIIGQGQNHVVAPLLHGSRSQGSSHTREKKNSRKKRSVTKCAEWVAQKHDTNKACVVVLVASHEVTRCATATRICIAGIIAH